MQKDNLEFSEKQINILKNYVSNISENVFALYNLPEVVKGALFSRYSRSTKSLRELLLKDFILSDDHTITPQNGEQDQMLAIKKAQNFYDRILDGFGDDSIGELGGTHLAVEEVSILASKVIEDCRIGGSPLEKSTRYVCFDQKKNGEYSFYKDPTIINSSHKDLYLNTCNLLFDTYKELIPPLTDIISKHCPREKNISENAYKASIRAKTLDCLRGLLPASTQTNLGIFGNGRFFEGLIRKLLCNDLYELKELGEKAFTELSKIIPSFVRRASTIHKNQIDHSSFKQSMHKKLQSIASKYQTTTNYDSSSVKLINYDPLAVKKVAAALLFENSPQSSLCDLQKMCEKLSENEINEILDAACTDRMNRRHKSPRALENAFFNFEIIGDFGAYRDLQRHRMLTQERQPLSCNHGYTIPEEIIGSAMENKYRNAMDEAKKAFDTISKDFPQQAQYIVPMAYNIRWYFHINLRGMQWLCELRSMPAGHENYRVVVQEMTNQVCEIFPQFKRFFKFVDYKKNALGRLCQEQYKENKKRP